MRIDLVAGKNYIIKYRSRPQNQEILIKLATVYTIEEKPYIEVYKYVCLYGTMNVYTNGCFNLNEITIEETDKDFPALITELKVGDKFIYDEDEYLKIDGCNIVDSCYNKNCVCVNLKDSRLCWFSDCTTVQRIK